jgi:hypothetical protein
MDSLRRRRDPQLQTSIGDVAARGARDNSQVAPSGASLANLERFPGMVVSERFGPQSARGLIRI